MSNISKLFSPASLAVIGASTNPDKLGGRPIKFLKNHGYPGEIYPINAAAGEVQGLKAYASVLDVPGPVDQALIVVPAGAVEVALRECAEKKVAVVQILSSGFAEAGEEGRQAQDRLVEIAREAGIRITGPNALGSVSPGDRFFGTFSTALNGISPLAGDIAIATQSGAFGSCAYVMATRRSIGLSRIVATGNEADIDVSDVIDFLCDDPQTKVICAAIESCKDGLKLRQALSRAAAEGKPVIVMKVGVSQVGAAAAATHTGSLAGDDAAFETIFRECGAYRARSIEEMIDVAYLVSVSGLPRNREISVLTVSGGIGILLADAAAELGLELPALAGDVLDDVRGVIPFFAGNNPLDMTAQFAVMPEAAKTVSNILFEKTDNGTIVFYLANNGLSPETFKTRKEYLIEVRRQHPDRLLVMVMPAHPDVQMDLQREGITVFEDPSRAIRALSAAAALRERRAALEPVRELPAAGQGERKLTVLNEAEGKDRLQAAGLAVVAERRCASADQAAEAAGSLGYPVAMKILSADILHKSDVGGVSLGIRDEAGLRRAYEHMLASVSARCPDARIEGVLVSPMVGDGLELIVAVHRDDVFGPLLMCGLGGTFVEFLKDVQFATLPLSRARAESLISSSRWSALLDGWRGGAKLDREALVDALLRLSALVEDHASGVDSVEINPLVVREGGCLVLDAVLSVAEQGSHRFHP